MRKAILAFAVLVSVVGAPQSAAAVAPPHLALAPGQPDVVEHGTCSDDARWRLELTDLGDTIKVRFAIHQSPVGDEWRIRVRPAVPFFVSEFFHGSRVASDRGVVVVQFRDPLSGDEGLRARAVDRQTGQVCEGSAWYGRLVRE